MKHNKLTVTIGIPAFNEEKNIAFLAKSILAQKQNMIKIAHIFIYSDASTDNTTAEITKVKNRRITLMKGTERKGQAVAQNRIIKSVNSDILVLLNADILIQDSHFIEKLVTPIIEKKADITSARVQELAPITLVEKILKASMDYKKTVFETFKSGNNICTCHGRARAFSKRFYKELTFISSIGEDAYSYLLAKKKNYNYQFVGSTEVFYRLPQTIQDHGKQSLRFYNSKEAFYKQFGKKLVQKEYAFPLTLYITHFIDNILKNPLLGMYVAMMVYLKINSLFAKNTTETWIPSETSKNLQLGGTQ